ncbi:MAG: OB-fold nucleic acid binding domain-containing protein, partial [Chloroflexota bacterium]|nr:OB-fold nucleic acid binding domain-containing protein [Chloroflexota bacterium]
ESLVKAGALDCFGERASVLASIERLIGAAQHRQKAAARGQMDLFGGVPEVVQSHATASLADVEPADRKMLLAWEKELLGLYLSAHPLMDILGSGPPAGHVQIAELPDRTIGERIRTIAMVTSIRRVTTKTNRSMAVLEIEDLTGSIEVVVFPDAYDQHSSLLESDAILSITAKLDERGEFRQLIADVLSSELPQPRRIEGPRRRLAIHLPVSEHVWQDIALMQEIDSALRLFEGADEVVFCVPNGASMLRLRSRSRRIEVEERLLSQLRSIVGESQVMLEESLQMIPSGGNLPRELSAVA